MSQRAEDIRDNIVKIVDDKGNLQGTGFIIEIKQDRYCITCHHCVCRLNEIYFERDSIKCSLDWNEELSDMSKDIAVMKVSDCGNVKPLKYAKQAMEQMPVSIWGYSDSELRSFPQGAPTKKGSLSDAPILFSWPEQNISGAKKWNKKPAVNMNVFLYDGKFHLGNSGAPVCYSGNNNVIGVLTAYEDDNYGLVIPIETILEKFDRIKVSEPSPSVNTSNHIQKGNDCYDKGCYAEAIRQYEIVLKDPNYAYAWYNKGLALYKLSRHYESLQSYDRALQIDPNSANGWFGKGLVLSELDRYLEAVQCYNTALQINPNVALLWNNKAWALVKLENYTEAIQCAEMALQIDPNLAMALDNKAWALGNLKKYDEAIICIVRALQINPNYALAWHRKGWTLEKLGRDDEAKQCFDMATQLGYKD